jgi:hypothetical protein
MNDFRHIRTVPGYRKLRASYLRRVHADSVLWLKTEAAACRGRILVVVTHCPPSARSILPIYAGDPLNAAFASNLDSLVADSGALLPRLSYPFSTQAIDYERARRFEHWQKVRQNARRHRPAFRLFAFRNKAALHPTATTSRPIRQSLDSKIGRVRSGFVERPAILFDQRERAFPPGH